VLGALKAKRQCDGGHISQARTVIAKLGAIERQFESVTIWRKQMLNVLKTIVFASVAGSLFIASAPSEAQGYREGHGGGGHRSFAGGGHGQGYGHYYEHRHYHPWWRDQYPPERRPTDGDGGGDGGGDDN
jgi:hypothetical protein